MRFIFAIAMTEMQDHRETIRELLLDTTNAAAHQRGQTIDIATCNADDEYLIEQRIKLRDDVVEYVKSVLVKK